MTVPSPLSYCDYAEHHALNLASRPFSRQPTSFPALVLEPVEAFLQLLLFLFELSLQCAGFALRRLGRVIHHPVLAHPAMLHRKAGRPVTFLVQVL